LRGVPKTTELLSVPCGTHPPPSPQPLPVPVSTPLPPRPQPTPPATARSRYFQSLQSSRPTVPNPLWCPPPAPSLHVWRTNAHARTRTHLPQLEADELGVLEVVQEGVVLELGVGDVGRDPGALVGRVLLRLRGDGAFKYSDQIRSDQKSVGLEKQIRSQVPASQAPRAPHALEEAGLPSTRAVGLVGAGSRVQDGPTCPNHPWTVKQRPHRPTHAPHTDTRLADTHTCMHTLNPTFCFHSPLYLGDVQLGCNCTSATIHVVFGACLAVTKCVSPKLRGLPAASRNRVTNGYTNGPEAVTK
jgi:hypothetical protein